MFERFTDGARSVLMLAREEARESGQQMLGTEHLLLGMLDEAGQVPFTPAAQAALERSSQESRRLAHAHIGTEHLLMELLGENSGVAVTILDTFDIAPAVALAAVQRLARIDGAIDHERREKGYARPRGRIAGWFPVPPSQPVRRLLVTAARSADMADHGEIELDDLLGAISSYAHVDALSEFGVDAARLHQAIARKRQLRSSEQAGGVAQPDKLADGADEDHGSVGLDPSRMCVEC